MSFKGVHTRAITRIRSSRDNLSELDKFALIVLSPAILFLFVLAIIPIFYLFYLSFYTDTLGSATWVGLRNYLELLASPEFWNSLIVGTLFALGSVVVQLGLGLMLSLMLNKTFKGVSIARTLAIFPYLVTIVIVALIWRFTAGPSLGIFQFLAIDLGLIEEPFPFLSLEKYALPIIILVGSWKFTAFAIIILLARLQSIPESMYEQAKISGASSFQAFRTITLPHLRSAILLVVLLRSIWLFNHFGLMWVLTRGGPGNATTNVPVFIYERAFAYFDIASAAAGSIILFLVLLVGAAIYFKVFQPGREIEV